MLIRSQDRTKLVDIAGKTISIKRINPHINNIEITYANSSVVLGAYNEENALKVLDVIEKTYCKRDSEYITFRMPKDENVSVCNYVEKPKYTVTSREKNFLDALLSSCKYIARDINNDLYIYYNKPRRNYINMNEYWITDNSNYFYVSRDMYGNMFNFIKWENEEPWSIEDLKKLEVKDE